MKYFHSIFHFVWKFTVVGIVFFSGFALLTLFLSRFLPDQSLMVWGFILLPYGWLMNRFILSPLEYHMDFKTMQYDQWYENRMHQKGQTSSSSQPR
ncbi:MAG: hypothetical protein ACFCUX_06650 [Candidatus Methylacidiphilales bacterium]